MSVLSVLAVLQAVRLKGRLAPAMLAHVSGLDEGDANAALSSALEDGLLIQTQDDGPIRISPAGGAELDALLTAERAGADTAALTAAYAEFDPLNTALKQIVGAWQLRDGQVPNDHTDPVYDGDVIARLVALHEESTPMFDAVVAASARLGHYPSRLDLAVANVIAGDVAFIARPTVDSYHQVWFELHQDLMDCLGLSRHEETLAGRA